MGFIVDGDLGKIIGAAGSDFAMDNHFVPSFPTATLTYHLPGTSAFTFVPPVPLAVNDMLIIQTSNIWRTGSGEYFRPNNGFAFWDSGSAAAGTLGGVGVRVQTDVFKITQAVLDNPSQWTFQPGNGGNPKQTMATFYLLPGMAVAGATQGVEDMKGGSSSLVTSLTPDNVSSAVFQNDDYLRFNMLFLTGSGVGPYSTFPGSYFVGDDTSTTGVAAETFYHAGSVGEIGDGNETIAWDGWTFPSARGWCVGWALPIAAPAIGYEEPTSTFTQHTLEPGTSDTRISLTTPTVLSFSTITWKFRFIHAYEEADMYNADGYVVQPDDLIGLDGGYEQTDYPWYTKSVEGFEEGLEVHASVDAAWWQVILTGRGQAVVTDGVSQELVDIASGEWYTMTMGLDGATQRLVLRDADENVLAEMGTDRLVLLPSESVIGASGTRFVPPDDNVGQAEILNPFSSNVEGHWYGQGHVWDGAISYSGLDLGAVDSRTGTVGTTSDTAAHPHTAKPYYSPCGGLDFTFDSARHVDYWVRLLPGAFFDLSDKPEWANYLRVKVPLQNTAFATGQPVWLMYKEEGDPPSRLWDGTQAGVGVVLNAGTSYIDGFVPIGAISDEGTIWLGVMTAFKAYNGIVHCGFTPGWDGGLYGSHRVNVTQAENWDYWWVQFSVDDSAKLGVEFDEILLDGMSVTDSDIVFDEGALEVSAGWNTEIVPVTGGLFSISATPSPGSLNVYDSEGLLLAYGVEWEEVDDLGLDYRITSGTHEWVTATYFVTEAMVSESQPVSRPDQDEEEVNVPLGTQTYW